MTNRRLGRLSLRLLSLVALAGVPLSPVAAQCTDLSPVVALGPVDNSTNAEAVLASTTLTRTGASDIRIYFAGGENLPKGSYVRVTSLTDYNTQEIDAQEISDWRWSSAWFNGDSVYVELVCGAQTKGNSVTITKTCESHQSSELLGCEPCAAQPPNSNVAWSARLVNINTYCSAAMWSTKGCLISAAHCNHPIGAVAEFNVPPSLPDGTPQHPRSDYQFVIIGREDGNRFFQDWAVLKLGRSARRTAFQKQQQLRRIGSLVTPAVALPITTPGYGLAVGYTGPGNLAQKITTGQVTSVVAGSPPPAFYYDGYSQEGNSGGGITLQIATPGSVQVLGGVFDSFCHAPVCENNIGANTLAWGVLNADFVAARASLCYDCVKDCNGDGHVDSDDRTILVGWIATNDPMGDLNGDGLVDSADLALWDSNWVCPYPPVAD